MEGEKGSQSQGAIEIGKTAADRGLEKKDPPKILISQACELNLKSKLRADKPQRAEKNFYPEGENQFSYL